MKVVIDTNIWVMSLSSRSKYHPIYSHLVKGSFEMVISNSISFEYQEIIASKFGSVVTASFFSLLGWLPNVIQVEPPYSLKLIKKDPDDDKFADAAIWGMADFIITEDAHFQELNSISFPKMEIKNIDAFLKILEE